MQLIAFAIGLTAAVVIVLLAWLQLAANTTRIVQGDLPEAREYGDGGL